MPGTQGIYISWKGIPEVTQQLMRAAERYRSPGHVNRLIRPAANKMKQEISSVTAATFLGKPHSTGNLAKSIKTWTYRDMRAVFAGANVGTKSARYPDGWYFGFHEKGTKTKSGKQHIRPKRMLERAYANRGQAVASEIANALLQDLKYFL